MLRIISLLRIHIPLGGWQFHRLHTNFREHAQELRCEQRISIMDE